MKNASVFWFTGLSGVGKSTVAEATKRILEKSNFRILVLDGDNVRKGLNKKLGFSESEIKKNNEIILQLCAKFSHEYDIIFVSIISPYRKSRNDAKRMLGKQFYEIYFTAKINTLFERDTKGLYKKTIKGKLNNLIGISKSSKYEPPKNPDLTLNTDNFNEKETIKYFVNFVKSKF